MAKEILTVKWTMDEGIIKFEERDVIYDLDEKVKGFIEKNPVEEGAKVEVEINPEAGDNDGVVEFLKVVKENTKKKTEAPVEDQTEEKEQNDEKAETEEKTLTLSGVSVKNKGVIFKEIENVWFTLADHLNADDVKKDCQGKLVKVNVAKTEEGKNDIICMVEIIKDVEPEKQEQAKPSTNSSYSTQCSIEAQVAMNKAIEFGIALIGTVTDLEEIKTLINERALANYKVMQQMRS